jgi:hypothetical protein
MTSFIFIKAAKNAWAFTFHHFLMADIAKPTSDISLGDICRPGWLSAAALIDGQDLGPILSKFMRIPVCSRDEEKQDPVDLSGNSIGRPALFAISKLLATTVHDVSYTEQLIARLPYSPSVDNPCDWEGVGLTYSSPNLYRLARNRDIDNNKVRFIVELEKTADMYVDQWAYGTVALMGNIFGLVGFYLGYSLIDIVTLLENGYLWIIDWRRNEKQVCKLREDN